MNEEQIEIDCDDDDEIVYGDDDPMPNQLEIWFATNPPLF